MKCRTSSSDLAILKKDITRFAPAWLGLCAYLTIWAVNLLTTDVYNGMFYEPIAPIFAPILSIWLFGYLCDPNEPSYDADRFLLLKLGGTVDQ